MESSLDVLISSSNMTVSATVLWAVRGLGTGPLDRLIDRIVDSRFYLRVVRDMCRLLELVEC